MSPCPPVPIPVPPSLSPCPAPPSAHSLPRPSRMRTALSGRCGRDPGPASCGGAGTHRDPPGPSGTHRDTAGHTGTHWDPPGHSGTHRDTPGPTGTQRDPPGPTGTQRDTAGPTGTHRDTPGPTGTHRDPHRGPPRMLRAMSAAEPPGRGMLFAETQLRRHGWRRGQGLGRREDGIAEAIRVKVKCDTAGVGHDAAEPFTFHWWDHVFNKAAANIAVEAGQVGGLGGRVEGRIGGCLGSSGDSCSATVSPQALSGSSTLHRGCGGGKVLLGWIISKPLPFLSQDGISVKALSEQGGSISNKKPRKAGSSGNLLYGRFVKSATLTACGEESVTASSESSQEEEEEEEKLDLSSIRRLTDEELVQACGGRTAHKGARHGLTMSAKLARLEEQERAFLATYRQREQQLEPPVSSQGKKKKRKQSRDGAEVPQSQEPNTEQEEVLEEEKVVKRKKKKQRSSREEEVTGEEEIMRKKKKKVITEPCGEEVSGDEGNFMKRRKKAELCAEEEVVEEDGKAAKRKKKKKKKKQEEEDKEEPAETDVSLQDTDEPNLGHSPTKKKKKKKRKREAE
uniref:G patch domain-containing protein 4 n=1 Tax=Geospiza parvula TaxID=87175 RepID=A0A8U8AXQ8_GEOPR